MKPDFFYILSLLYSVLYVISLITGLILASKQKLNYTAARVPMLLFIVAIAYIIYHFMI